MTKAIQCFAKILFSTFILCSLSVSAGAKEINTTNFQGVYHIKVEVLNKKALYILTIRPSQVFEVTRQYDDGHLGQLCNGTYTLAKVSQPPMGTTVDLIMKGSATCPSNRSEVQTLEINMKNAQTKDLERGLNVEIYSSEAAVKLQAKMKKQ